MMDIETKRRRALRINARHNWNWKTLLQYRAFQAAEDETVHLLRQARVARYLLRHYPTVVRGGDLIVGSLPVHATPPEAQAELDEADAYLWRYKKGLPFGPGNGGVGGHRAVDFNALLSEGVLGILHRIDEAENTLQDSDPDATGKRIFYQSCRIALEGLLEFAERFRRECLRWAEKQPARKAAWLEIASRFEHIPAHPPRTFAEALQSVWTLQLALRIADDTSCAGRPDQYLLPFYERGMAEGTLDRASALALICDYYIRANEVFGRWPWTIMLGGRTPRGLPVENELTRLFLDAVEIVRLVNPNVSLCVHEDLSDDILLRGLQLNVSGLSSPAYYNDRVITEGLRMSGLQDADASQYINSTCVEITPIGCSNVQVAVVHLYPAKTLNMLLLGGDEAITDERMSERLGQGTVEQWKRPWQQGGILADLGRLETFEDFKAIYFKALGRTMRDCVRWGQALAWRSARYGSCPLVSCFTRHCIALGKDVAAGGALANHMGTTVAGFSTTVDALLAIRQTVYTDRVLTLEQLARQLRENFDGAESVRKYLLNRCPKYGNGLAEADAMACELYDFLRAELQRYRTCLGGHFQLGIFSGWGQSKTPRGAHVSFGLATGATPDGRKAGMPLSENIGPAAGSDRNGPTAMIQSVTRMDHRHGLGGISVNLRLSPASMATDDDRRKVLDLLREFMRRGGLEIQLNIVDDALLEEARQHPENYRYLTVRIAGYSDYFTTLDPLQQEELIHRTRHQLTT